MKDPMIYPRTLSVGVFGAVGGMLRVGPTVGRFYCYDL